MGNPIVVVFPAGMSQPSCLQLCENLGSKAPSIIAIEDWSAVKNFLQKYDSLNIWVAAINDEEKEGEWRDAYTSQIMNNSQAWLPGAPNNGEYENHAYLIKDTKIN